MFPQELNPSLMHEKGTMYDAHFLYPASPRGSCRPPLCRAGAEPPQGGPPPGMVGPSVKHTWQEPADPPGMMGPPGMVGPVGMMGPPAFLEHLFPPELVMRYQSDLGLTPAQ